MNSGTALAVVLAVLSAACYAAGAVAQERTARRGVGDGASAARGFGWWLAIGGNAAGAVLHVLALRYGALSVVQPLGALTLVFSPPLAALAVGRRGRPGELLGAGLTVVGLGVLLSIAPAGAYPGSLSTTELSGLAAVVAAGTAAALWWARRTARPVGRGLLLGSAAGVAFAFASVLTQQVSVQVAGQGWSAVGGPATVLLAGAAAAGVLLSQAAYRAGGLAVPLTAVTLANPIAATAVGVALLGERFTGGPASALVAVVAAAVTVRGVLLLTADGAAGSNRPASGDARARTSTGPAVNRADQALYGPKRDGRNRVVRAAPDLVGAAG